MAAAAAAAAAATAAATAATTATFYSQFTPQKPVTFYASIHAFYAQFTPNKHTQTQTQTKGKQIRHILPQFTSNPPHNHCLRQVLPTIIRHILRPHILRHLSGGRKPGVNVQSTPHHPHNHSNKQTNKQTNTNTHTNKITQPKGKQIRHISPHILRPQILRHLSGGRKPGVNVQSTPHHPHNHPNKQTNTNTNTKKSTQPKGKQIRHISPQFTSNPPHNHCLRQVLPTIIRHILRPHINVE